MWAFGRFLRSKGTTTFVLQDSAQKNNELGIELAGGRDDPAFDGTVPIYVKSLTKNSKFESILR